jgi:hypothetical protein
MPARPGHALIAEDHRYIPAPRLSQSGFGVSGCEDLVIVFEEALQRLEDENFIVQN